MHTRKIQRTDSLIKFIRLFDRTSAMFTSFSAIVFYEKKNNFHFKREMNIEFDYERIYIYGWNIS